MATRSSPRYRILRVLDQRDVNGRTQYYVERAGSPVSIFSWVPPFAIPHRLLYDYLRGNRRVETRESTLENTSSENTSSETTSSENTSLASTSLASDSSSGDNVEVATGDNSVSDASNENNSVALAIPQRRRLYGFDLNWRPNKIINLIRRPDDTIEFVLAWEQKSMSQYVPADLAKEKCPQLVIEYYESIIKWRDPPTIDPNASDSDSD